METYKVTLESVSDAIMPAKQETWLEVQVSVKQERSQL
jgi:hypothetical protein